MNSGLRSDELFVIRSIADHFLGTWSIGEDPPDAYLNIGEIASAIEISTLTQHVIDEQGVSRPRLSYDSPAINLANELNDELKALVPAGLLVILVLTSPILKARRVKPKLKNTITTLIFKKFELNSLEVILGNQIDIHIVKDDRPSGKKLLV